MLEVSKHAQCTFCNDNRKNGDETHIDCGGSCNASCVGGCAFNMVCHDHKASMLDEGWSGDHILVHYKNNNMQGNACGSRGFRSCSYIEYGRGGCKDGCTGKTTSPYFVVPHKAHSINWGMGGGDGNDLNYVEIMAHPTNTQVCKQ